MSNQWSTKNGRTSKRGLFVNGIWHCDCDTRLPADKFQVKNGGKNHGRWFYTCQKSQPKRCGFFLWSDDAKVREEGAVLDNSRSEPKTPKKQTKILPITPTSRPRQEHIDHSFDWSSSADEELLAVADDVEQSPSKVARTNTITSPGKRKTTPSSNDDVFMTPSAPTKSATLSPQPTSALRQAFVQAEADNPLQAPSALATQALSILSPVASILPPATERDLVDLLNRHHLKTQGIARGRDIVRLAVNEKDKRIAELQSRITTLEAERETSRTVIAALKTDIANSPKKPRRPKKPDPTPTIPD